MSINDKKSSMQRDKNSAEWISDQYLAVYERNLIIFIHEWWGDNPFNKG